MPGTLGAENLSTGANVSRTMESLNSKNQSETGTSVFSKHKFDRAEPDGSILIPESKGLFFRKSRGDKNNDITGSMIAARGESVDGLDPETRRKRRMLRIGGVIGGALAVILAVVIVVVLVVAPRGEKGKATFDRTALAEFVVKNQSLDLLELEKIFAQMYAGNVQITKYYSPDISSLSEKYAVALNSISTIRNKIMESFSSKNLSNSLRDRLTRLNAFLESRQSTYTQILSALDNFYTLITTDDATKRDAVKTELRNVNNIKIQKILSDVEADLKKAEDVEKQYQGLECQEMTVKSQPCRNLSTAYSQAMSYIDSPKLTYDIVNAFSNPIDYDTESYILYNLYSLVYDLKDGNDTPSEVENPLRGEIIVNTEVVQNEK